jgi:hypothetical protein
MLKFFYYKTYIRKDETINYKLHVQKLISFKCDSINSIIDLESEEQPTLGSFGQFFLVNINLSKLPICTLHIFKFINILAKEKILSISIWDPTIKDLTGQGNQQLKTRIHVFFTIPKDI